MRRAFASLAFFAMGLAALPVLADPPGLKPLAIGSAAPDFRLPGVDGKTYGLKDFADAKVLVVAFTCNHCPTANAYEARFKKFTDDYKSKGVAFVAISPNDPKAVRLDELGYSDLDDSFESMKIRARDHHYNFPYLYDGETQATSVSTACWPRPTRFSSMPTASFATRVGSTTPRPLLPKSHDAINAVDAILAGFESGRRDDPRPRLLDQVAGQAGKAARQWLAKADNEPVQLEEIDAPGVAKLVKNDTKKLLLVNVWATWCGPCVAEFPGLVEMNRMYRGRAFRLATISLDEPAKKKKARRSRCSQRTTSRR